MRFSVALDSGVHAHLIDYLLRQDGQEYLCFVLWYPSKGSARTTALIHDVLLPEPGDHNLHGNVSFNSQYVTRVIALARQTGAGIALAHSHLGPGWQGMSDDDIRAERSIAGPIFGATHLPCLGLTLGTDGTWSARFWQRDRNKCYQPQWCESVRVAGASGLIISYADHLRPLPEWREELARTVSAWGDSTQAQLARLHVGVVGLGSVGSMVAETLARMGIQEISLIDFDTIELVNLDRHLHATRADIGKLKVAVVAERLRLVQTARECKVHEITDSLVEPQGFTHALDCDVLLGCVDRPWPRAVLNFLAYAHLIPVVDSGIHVQKKRDGALMNATWKAHVAMPTRRCLACLRQYEPCDVASERAGQLDDPEYIKSLDEKHHLRRNENVFAFSLSAASLAIHQMLALVVRPNGISNLGEFCYHFTAGTLDVTRGKTCHANCPYPTMAAKGDGAGFTVTGTHKVAEATRGRAHERKPAGGASRYLRPLGFVYAFLGKLADVLRLRNVR